MSYMQLLSQGNKNKKIGIYYESVAKDYLMKQGYQIKKMNYKCKLGEIDIIAIDGEYTVFVEVKYRSNIQHGYPREYVNYSKQKRIIRVAQYYLMINRLTDKPVRFDVIEIIGETINHLLGVFY